MKPTKKSGAPARALVPATASSAALVAMPEPGESLDRAGRVNFFHRLSREAGVVSIRAALAAGLELLAAKEELSGGFQKWVQSKCSFGTATAYRYIAIVQRSLPEQTLPGLLAGSDSEREAAVEAAAAGTDSRTLTELYDDLGIVRKTPSNLGGRRNEAAEANGHKVGRPPKRPLGNEEIAAQAAALSADPKLAAKELEDLLAPLVAWANGRAGFGALPDRELASARARLSDLLGLADEALAARKAGKGAAK